MEYLRARGRDFDPGNLSDLRSIMDEHGENYAVYFGVNGDGDAIRFYITHDRLALRTFLSSGWQRVDVYRREGTHSVSYDPFFPAA